MLQLLGRLQNQLITGTENKLTLIGEVSLAVTFRSQLHLYFGN